MPNDARLGLVVGVTLVILVAVFFCARTDNSREPRVSHPCQRQPVRGFLPRSRVCQAFLPARPGRFPDRHDPTRSRKVNR